MNDQFQRTFKHSIVRKVSLGNTVALGKPKWESSNFNFCSRWDSPTNGIGHG